MTSSTNPAIKNAPTTGIANAGDNKKAPTNPATNVTNADSKIISTNPASLFITVPSLQHLIDQELLEEKGGIKGFFDFFAQVPESQKKALKLLYFPRIAHRLCLAAIQRKYEEVDQLLTLCPLLLLERATVTDYSGRKHFNRTVYQLVLGANDKNVNHAKWDEKKKEYVSLDTIAIPGMIEMVEKHFHRLSAKRDDKAIIEQDAKLDYEALMKEQYKEIYPDNHKDFETKEDIADDAAYEAGMTAIRNASQDLCRTTNTIEDKIYAIRRKEQSERALELRSITQSIYHADSPEIFEIEFKKLKIYLQTEEKELVNNSFDFTVLEAIYRFRNYWESKWKNNPHGRHFNHGSFDKASSKYDANYEKFAVGRKEEGVEKEEKYEAPKNILSWQKFFGYMCRFVPTCDGKVIAQGLWSVLVSGEKFHDSLNWGLGGGYHFPPDTGCHFPLDTDPDWELGHNCAGGGYRSRPAAGPWAAARPVHVRHLYNTYVKQKREPIVIMRRRDNPSPTNPCVIL